MRQATRKGLMTVAAATGVIAAAGGQAHAHSGASGSASHSPGVLSGNTVQAPVHVPVNVCGNTVNVVGVLNPAAGNACGRPGHDGPGGHGGSGGAHTGGHTSGSPGVGSGNHVEAPVHAPVNVCGNTVDVIGLGNAALGNDCADGGGHTPPPGTEPPGTPPPGTEPPGTPPPGTEPPGTTPPGTPEQPGDPGTPDEPGVPDTPPGTDDGTPGGDPGGRLAETGSGLPVGAAASLGAGALLAGAVLYRRARAAA
ncbi:chaplin [Streptomyces glaucescens]|uniref:chaplin n=1 Tax=Streptomyces glaucescens TaxID=1907 RepID=UPI00344DA5AE